MTRCASPESLSQEPVSYDILVRGSVDESIKLGFPGLMLAPADGNTLISGVFPLREHLFELLQHLADSGLEFLSASASPPEDLPPSR
jgi:hypothetical protein